MYQFIRALRFKDTMRFKELFRSVDVLMIDDVQFIGGKDSTQEEFFHTFNTLIDRGSQIVISSDRSPAELSGLEERIRSRLGWGLVVDIHPSTYELRLGILQSKAEGLAAQVKVPDRVLEFLAHRITSNIRELEGALNRIVAQATLVGRAITLEMAQEVLQDLLRAHERRITIEEIQKRVAEHYGIKLSDMHSARRARVVARPRQVAMYLAKQLTPRFAPRDRPAVRRPRSHYGDACDQEDRGIARRRRGHERGYRKTAPSASRLTAGRPRARGGDDDRGAEGRVGLRRWMKNCVEPSAFKGFLLG